MTNDVGLRAKEYKLARIIFIRPLNVVLPPEIVAPAPHCYIPARPV